MLGSGNLRDIFCQGLPVQPLMQNPWYDRNNNLGSPILPKINLFQPSTMTSNDENTDGTDNSDNDDEATKGGKRRERLEQNRISARESRKRKKNMIEELQRTVITLSRENKELNERNETLRRELVEIGTKNPGVVNIQALMSCSGGGAIEDGVGGTGIAPVPGGEEGGGSTSIVNNNEFTAVDNNLSNPQAAQNQLQPPAISMAALNGFNPQQLTMMQQMMALQQAGMLPQMMGMMGMSGVAAGGMVGHHQHQQQDQTQQQHQLQQQQHQPPSSDGLN